VYRYLKEIKASCTQPYIKIDETQCNATQQNKNHFPKYTFFLMAHQPLVGQDVFIIEVLLSKSDSPHSIKVVRRNNQSDAVTSAWQHTKLKRDRHP